MLLYLSEEGACLILGQHMGSNSQVQRGWCGVVNLTAPHPSQVLEGKGVSTACVDCHFSSGSSERNPWPKAALLTSPQSRRVGRSLGTMDPNSGEALQHSPAFSSYGTSHQACLTTNMNPSEDENLDECGPASRENITSFGDEPLVQG